MKKLNSSAYVLIGIIVVMLAAIAQLLTYQSFATRIMPLVVSSTVCVLAAFQLWREIGAKSTAEKKIAKKEPGSEEWNVKAHEYLPYAAWLAGLAIAIFLVGFYISTFLFVLFYMKCYGAKWPAASILTVLTTWFLYLIFEIILRTGLYEGLLLSLF